MYIKVHRKAKGVSSVQIAFETSLSNYARKQHFSTPFTFTSPNDRPKRLKFLARRAQIKKTVALAVAVCCDGT